MSEQETPLGRRAITSAAFFRLAVRRDLQLAPHPEHPTILAQAHRLQTMGEVAAYARRVMKETARRHQAHISPSAPTHKSDVSRSRICTSRSIGL